MQNLFENTDDYNFKPLAEKMRPLTLDDFYGQEDVVGEQSSLREMIKNDSISSMILWGPPGVGKTTLAKIIANQTNSAFLELSAVTSGVKDIKDIIEIAHFNKSNGKKTIVFVDEIHRFNKAQQDAFLPFVENGDIILIGATTENPSFEVNSALISRSKVYMLNTLNTDDLKQILKRAIEKNPDYQDVIIKDEQIETIANVCNGDARYALNTLESIIKITPSKKNKREVTKAVLEKVLASKLFLYDKNGEEHYNLISALHKSMRNSDPDAAIYYLARMLEAGEDPLYVARRLVRFASEDIGLADPNALVQATTAYNAAHFLGLPECNVNLAQAVIYLSVSPKSNALYKAYETVKKDAIATANESVPLHLRNAVTKLDKEMNYGKGYKYAHDYDDKITNMQCLPDSLKNKKYYIPTEKGKEKNIKEVLSNIEKVRKQK